MSCQFANERRQLETTFHSFRLDSSTFGQNGIDGGKMTKVFAFCLITLCIVLSSELFEEQRKDGQLC